MHEKHVDLQDDAPTLSRAVPIQLQQPPLATTTTTTQHSPTTTINIHNYGYYNNHVRRRDTRDNLLGYVDLVHPPKATNSSPLETSYSTASAPAPAATTTTTKVGCSKHQHKQQQQQQQQQHAADGQSALFNNFVHPSLLRLTLGDDGKLQTSSIAVGLVRTTLVILICVLLVKMRTPNKAKRRQQKGLRDTDTNGAAQNWIESQTGTNSREQFLYSNASDMTTSTHSSEISNNVPLSASGVIGGIRYANQSINNQDSTNQRRHSHALGPNGANLLLQRQQISANLERQRRHSDTTLPLVANMKLPPGPTGLPFLGYLPFLGSEIHLTLTSLSERFGPIYQIFLGNIRVVVLNDAALVRQAFKQAVFSGRPDTQLTRILQGYGIVNSEGALWKEQRAFLHSALRKLGAKSLMSGTNGLESKIQNQVKEFVNDLSVHANEGKPCQVRPIVARAVSSVVGSIVMNLTYRKYEEKEKFDRLIELMQEGFRLFSIAMPLDFIPLFRFLPGVSYAYQKMKRNRAETSAFFQTVADEHRKYLSERFNLGAPSSASSLHPRATRAPPTSMAAAAAAVDIGQQRQQLLATKLQEHSAPGASNQHTAASAIDIDSNNNSNSNSNSNDKNNFDIKQLDNIVARDLVDAYIVQQKKHEKDGKENYFSDQQLVQIMSDIFSAGLETVTSTIEWSILFLILNVECQERIQEEIDNIIGRDRMPQLEDLCQMPYTEATIYEVLRRSNVVALGNAHATLADASIGGYRIPKGTQVLPNLYGIHMNPRLWHEPDRFNPSRFIVNEKAQKPDFFIPFSTGRRMCLGDVLAKMEVFLFLVGLLQRYDLSVHDEDRDCPPQVKGTIGVSNAPVSFRVALNLRPTTGQVATATTTTTSQT